MDGLIVASSAGILEAGAFEHATQVFEGNSAIDLDERPLDDVLELGRIDSARTA